MMMVTIDTKINLNNQFLRIKSFINIFNMNDKY